MLESSGSRWRGERERDFEGVEPNLEKSEMKSVNFRIPPIEVLFLPSPDERVQTATESASRSHRAKKAERGG